MPDRYGDHDDETARCDLCDDDGMRGMYVCDHVDYASASRRGMDMIRRAMGWDQRNVHPYCNRCGIPHAAGNCKRPESA